MPGGVNSPVRALGSIGLDPISIASGAGAEITDVDGNVYLDWMCSWGPLIAGHAHPAVIEAVTAAAARGTSFGATTEAELRLAEEVVDRVPSRGDGADGQLRHRGGHERDPAGAGGHRAREAAQVRRRLPRPRGRAAGRGRLRAGHRVAARQPRRARRPGRGHGDRALERPRGGRGGLRRAPSSPRILCEPYPANMGLVLPERRASWPSCASRPTPTARCWCSTRSSRASAWPAAAPRSAKGVTPDLTILGKVIGGGVPAAAYAGRADLLRQVAPAGDVYQAGTLSGNPLATAAGLATLELLDAAAYERLEAVAATLADGLREAAADAGVPVHVCHTTGLLTVFFHDGPVGSYADAKECDTERFGAFARAMLERGVYLPPSQFEAWFVSLAHSDEQVERTLDAAREALAA